MRSILDVQTMSFPDYVLREQEFWAQQNVPYAVEYLRNFLDRGRDIKSVVRIIHDSNGFTDGRSAREIAQHCSAMGYWTVALLTDSTSTDFGVQNLDHVHILKLCFS